MIFWILITHTNQIITTIDTLQTPFESNLYNQWHSTTITVNDQQIPGCFLDFSSSKTWIASRDLCSKRPCAFGSLGFRPITIQNQPDSIEFGSVRGTSSMATFQLGSIQAEYDFLLANESAVNWSCSLGLAPNGILTKLQNLHSNTLSFYHLQGGGGRLVFGGMDMRNTTPIEWIPAKEQSWKVNVKLVIQTTEFPGLDVMFMSRYNDFTFLPFDLARRINEQLGLRQLPGTFHNAIGWGIECTQIPTNFPNLQLDFGNVMLTLPPTEYLFQTNVYAEPLCLSSIFGIPSASRLEPSIGSIMLKQYLVIFDFQNLGIGFAKMNMSKLDTVLVPISAPFKPSLNNSGISWWVIVLAVCGGVFLVIMLVIIKMALARKKEVMFIRHTPYQVQLPGPFNNDKLLREEQPRKRIIKIEVEDSPLLSSDVVEMSEMQRPPSIDSTNSFVLSESRRALSPISHVSVESHHSINSHVSVESHHSINSHLSVESSLSASVEYDPSHNLNSVKRTEDPSQNLNRQVQ